MKKITNWIKKVLGGSKQAPKASETKAQPSPKAGGHAKTGESKAPREGGVRRESTPGGERRGEGRGPRGGEGQRRERDDRRPERQGRSGGRGTTLEVEGETPSTEQR